MVKTLCFHCRGSRFNLGWGTRTCMPQGAAGRKVLIRSRWVTPRWVFHANWGSRAWRRLLPEAGEVKSRKGSRKWVQAALGPAPEQDDLGTCWELTPGPCSLRWAGGPRVTGQPWTAEPRKCQKVIMFSPRLQAATAQSGPWGPAGPSSGCEVFVPLPVWPSQP